MGKFEKGHPKFGGRKKGTDTLKERCAALGLNVFDEMAKLAIAELDADKKFQKLSQLAPYLYSKPREEIDVKEILASLGPQALREMVMELIDEQKSA